jgi:hypothetical protein
VSCQRFAEDRHMPPRSHHLALLLIAILPAAARTQSV